MGEVPAPADGALVSAVQVDGELALNEVRQLIDHTQELVEQANNVSEAAVLVRRSSAAVKLVPEALKACRVLEEEQFQLRQDAAEAHLRTQRKAGELLRRMDRNRGGRPPETPRTGETVLTVQGVPEVPTLKELGITHDESHRWQLIASIPSDVFEEYIVDSNERHREITTRGAIAIAHRMGGAGKPKGSHEPPPESPEVEAQRVSRQVSDLVWLNPASVARAMKAGRLMLADLQRLREWLAEVEAALRL